MRRRAAVPKPEPSEIWRPRSPDKLHAISGPIRSGNARRTHALHGAHGPQRRRGAACDHKARTHNKAHPEKQRDGSRSNLVDEQARKRVRDKRGNRARQKHETSLHGASPAQSFNIKRHKQRNAHERSKQAIERPEAVDEFPVVVKIAKSTSGFSKETPSLRKREDATQPPQSTGAHTNG